RQGTVVGPPTFLPKAGDSRVQGYPIHPGAYLRFMLKRRIGLPELQHNLLEKIFPLLGVPAVHAAHLMDQGLILGNELDEFCTKRRVFHRGKSSLGISSRSVG